AAALYETLPRKFPTSVRGGSALLAAGKCWYQAGDFLRAEQALSAALTKKFDDAAEAAYWLGQTLLKRNRPADAVTVLDRAIAACCPSIRGTGTPPRRACGWGCACTWRRSIPRRWPSSPRPARSCATRPCRRKPCC